MIAQKIKQIGRLKKIIKSPCVNISERLKLLSIKRAKTNAKTNDGSEKSIFFMKNISAAAMTANHTSRKKFLTAKAPINAAVQTMGTIM